MKVDVAAPARQEPPDGGAVGAADRRISPGWVAAAVAVIGAGIVVRFVAVSDLWLDEALSVTIARLPLDRLRVALLHDGAPPLYYVLLHAWTAVFGTSTAAVRALSGVLGVIAIGLAFLAGRAASPDPGVARRIGWVTAVVVATSPFAIRYSSEARMYELAIVLGLLGIWLGLRAWREPTVLRLAGVAIATAGLVYTVYWAWFLVAVVGAGLALTWARAHASAAPRLLGALAGGTVLFVPWLPTFRDQLDHTGTPWDAPAALVGSARRAFVGLGGAHAVRWPLVAVMALAIVVALVAGDRRGGAVSIVRLAAAVTVATVLLGVVASVIAGTGFHERYATVVFPVLALAVGAAIVALPGAVWRGAVLGVLVVGGLAGGWQDTRAERTASTTVAAALRARLHRGDVVAYCPDQLAPSTARLLDAQVDQVTFPRLDGPRLVDWTDYAARNRRGSPTRFAAAVDARAGGGTVWLVWSPGYRTLGTRCEQVVNALARTRVGTGIVAVADGPNGEQVGVRRFDP